MSSLFYDLAGLIAQPLPVIKQPKFKRGGGAMRP